MKKPLLFLILFFSLFVWKGIAQFTQDPAYGPFVENGQTVATYTSNDNQASATSNSTVALDYFEDFEGPNPGWTLSNGTQVNKWVIGEAAYASSSHSLYISNNNGVSNIYDGTSSSVVHAYKDVIIPSTAVQISISYDWKANGESSQDFMRVWLVPASFVPTPSTMITAGGGRVQLGTNYNLQNTWQTAEIVLNVPTTWSGQIMRLVFEWRNDGSMSSQSPAAVDNINISVITCPAPSVPTLASVAINTATTTWNGTSASYDYYYSTTNTAPGPTTAPSDSSATNQANLTGLIDAAVYYFWVRSNCGDDGVSFWVGPLIFNTAQIPANLPYYEHFDGANSKFTFNNGNEFNEWIIGGATFNSPSQSLYISDDNGVTNSYGGDGSVIQAYRDIQLPASIDQLYLAFDWKCTGDSWNSDYMNVWIVPQSFTPTPGNEITDGAGRMKISEYLNGQTSWKTQSYIFNAPTAWEGQIVRLVFEWRNNGIIFNLPPAAVDNINFSAVTCSPPMDLAVTAVTAGSVTFTWNAPSGTVPSSYDYCVSTSNTSPSPTASPTGSSLTTSVTAVGLDDSTQYFLWIRSNCGGAGGKSFWVGPISFSTPQIPATNNLYDDFEGPVKWTFINGTQLNKWVVGTATSSNSTRSLYISNDSGVTNSYAGTISVTHAYRELQMPDVVDQIALSFDWKGYGESTFDYMRVWLVPVTFMPTPGTQITPGAGRVQIGANFNQRDTWKAESFIFTGTQYQGQLLRLIFEWNNDYFVFNQPPAAVDNVVFNMLTCSSPINLVSSAIPGSLQVNLTWTPVGIENQWEIIIQPLGSGLPSLNAIGIIVNDASFIFLANSDELYEFYVRAICSEEDKSQWSTVEYFSIFNPPGCASIDVVGTDTTVYNASIYSCPAQDTEVNLSASFFGISSTTSYEVTSIDYAPPFPFVGGEVLSVTIDDRYSPVVDLPFNFCFFGDSYTKAKVGSNGVVVFGNDELVGEDICPWAFSGQIPNAAFPIKNAIYGVYQDTYPTVSAGITNYQVLGTYPCRALVVNFYELPHYSCGSFNGGELQTSQIVIYEISNIIEVYIGNRTPCVGWQDGVGVVGIQNNVGTQAYVPPGRNTGSWSAQNEAWRFTPNGTSTFDFQWLVEGQFLSDQEEITLSLTPAQIVELQANGYYTLTVTAEATYDTCSIGATPITTSRDIDVTFIYSYPDNEPINLVDNAVAGNMEFDLTINDLVMLQGANNPSIYRVNYYNSLADAESGDLILAITNPEAYIGQNNEIIWVNVSDVANCGAGIPKSFSLLYEGLEDCVTPQIEAPTPLVVCNDNHNGFAEFDLTIRNSQILNGLDPTDHTIIFYTTEFDASAGTNVISNPTNYINIVANQDSVWVSVTDLTTGCFAIRELFLILQETATDPIATSPQILFVGQTIADIEVIGNNLTWYTDLALTDEIDDTTVLTQGVHTFYVTASIGNCTSDAIEIIIEVALSTEDFYATLFNVYPNPVKDFLNISYNKDIQNITIVNMLGQSLFSGVVNATETKVDMTQLPTGSYLVKLTVDGIVKTIKVIKQ